VFWQPLFWGLLAPCLIILGIMYGTTKKVYKLFYILSLFVYIITIAYIIDVFDLGRNWILGLLTFSAFLMIFIAYWLSKKGDDRPKKAKKLSPTKRPLWTVGGILAVMLLVIIVSGLNMNVERDVSIVPSLERSKLLLTTEKSDQIPPALTVELANFTYTNGFFLPVVVEDQYFLTCWYDTTKEQAAPDWLQTQVNGQQNTYQDFNEPMTEVAAGETLTLKVTVTGTSYYAPKETAPIGSNYDQYDAIVLATFNDQTNIDCTRLASLKESDKLVSYTIIPLK